ncbi:MAG: hypothetical protein L0Z50_01150 [Verrucomicrobiales bacterium]|nr:hypothetical protein [Verrucomicrobiales bacterium]
MKLKLLLIIAGIALAGSTVTIVVIQPKDRKTASGNTKSSARNPRLPTNSRAR